MTTRWMDSPIGGLRIHVSAGLVTAIDFGADQPRGARLADPLLDRAETQLEEYFAGQRTIFDLPLASEGSEFQKKVWSELQRIPFGETASYGDIARRLGYEPGISRAVGAANGANPIPIVVPCHRVVGADGSLTGYAGGIERKRTLLALERPGLF
jgi:methylated-DNA-[protein]-cysteine S-methyltransferase